MNIWIFSIVFTLIMSLMATYIYFRLIKKITTPYLLIVLKVLLFYGFVSMLLYPLQRVVRLDYILMMFFHYGLGVFFLLIFISLFYDLIYSTSLGISKIVPIDQNRRKALKTFGDISFIIMAVLYFFKAFAYSLKQPTINKTNIKIKFKNHKLNNFTILQISDLHIGDIIKKEYVKQMVLRINKFTPDIVVLTGDIIDLKLKRIKDSLQELELLSNKYGIYMSLGNHEYYQGDLHKVIKYLKQTKIKLLINESVLINNKFNLIGLADRQGYKFNYLKPDVAKSFANIDNTKPTIIMSHQPIMIHEIEAYKPNLVLSGHTHGGQIFPFGILVKLAQKYLSGLYSHNKHTQIFVSRGAGYWGPPIRVLADNEVNLLTLVD